VSGAYLIVNADDLGLTEGNNRAVVEAHSRGILTSTSLLACGMAFDDAVARVRELPALGVGVHLTLLEGVPALPAAKVPDLVDEYGRFGLSYARLFRRPALGSALLKQVRREWRAQIEKVLATGLPATHLDSHKHVHMHPQLLEVVLGLADEFGIRRMRLSRPLHLASGPKSALLGLLALWARRQAARRGVRSPDALQMTEARMLAALKRTWQGVRELMVHPAYPSADLDRFLAEGYAWIAGYRFAGELAALCSPTVRQALDQAGIQRIHYGDLQARIPPARWRRVRSI
jgi:hopanoid biosynthesis associated protein HpnK